MLFGQYRTLSTQLPRSNHNNSSLGIFGMEYSDFQSGFLQFTLWIVADSARVVMAGILIKDKAAVRCSRLSTSVPGHRTTPYSTQSPFPTSATTYRLIPVKSATPWVSGYTSWTCVQDWCLIGVISRYACCCATLICGLVGRGRGACYASPCQTAMVFDLG
jgi:hypothetical protein